MTRQELFTWIRQQYGTEPEYPWHDWNAVLRHNDNNKWYGVVLEVSADKLGLPEAGIIDVLNVKSDPLLIGSLRGQDGYFPAYYMKVQGRDYDCVTRSFVPKCKVPEEPVCGRGHCHLVPIWAEMLGKNDLRAYQASARGGVLYCHYTVERVYLSGKAVFFSESEIHIQ